MSKDRPTLANDGYSRGGLVRADGYSKLAEGYVRKGGSNTPMSQIQTRPAPPASMQPRPSAPASGQTPAAPAGDAKQR